MWAAVPPPAAAAAAAPACRRSAARSACGLAECYRAAHGSISPAWTTRNCSCHHCCPAVADGSAAAGRALAATAIVHPVQAAAGGGASPLKFLRTRRCAAAWLVCKPGACAQKADLQLLSDMLSASAMWHRGGSGGTVPGQGAAALLAALLALSCRRLRAAAAA